MFHSLFKKVITKIKKLLANYQRNTNISALIVFLCTSNNHTCVSQKVQLYSRSCKTLFMELFKMTGCRDDEIDSNTRTGVISQAALRESLQRKSKSSSCTSAKRKVAGKSNGPCEEKLNLRTEERLRSVDRLAAKQLAKSYTAKVCFVV